MNLGGPGNLGICTLACGSDKPGSCIALAEGFDAPLVAGSVADGGGILSFIKVLVLESYSRFPVSEVSGTYEYLKPLPVPRMWGRRATMDHRA